MIPMLARVSFSFEKLWIFKVCIEVCPGYLQVEGIERQLKI